MRINFILYSILRTGAIRIFIEYANLLSQRGYDVVLYHTLFPYKQRRKRSFWEFIRQVKAKILEYFNGKKNLQNFENINFRIRLIPFVSNLFLRNANAVIFSYWPIAYTLKDLSGKKGKIIYLIQAYETWDSDLELLHQTFNLGFHNVSVSNSIRKLIKSKTGADSDVILNGIDYKKFYQKTGNSSGTSGRKITFVYYPMRFKGSFLVIEAIGKVKKIFPDIEVKCFGMNYPEKLPGYIKYIHNPGDSHIREIFNDTDIFISASEEEGFYLIPAEAMACGCAVITTNVGAVKEFSEDNVSALHFDPGDADKLMSHLIYLLENPAEVKLLSNNAVTYIQEKLNWERSVEQLMNIIMGK